MPRDGALVLSDLRQPTLSIVCEPCGRRGRYNVAKLMEQHGDAKLTDLLQTLADCQKARSASVYDRCKVALARNGHHLALTGRSSAFARQRAIVRPHCDVAKPCAGRHAEHEGAEKREKHERAHTGLALLLRGGRRRRTPG